jgi:hypothetical protein
MARIKCFCFALKRAEPTHVRGRGDELPKEDEDELDRIQPAASFRIDPDRQKSTFKSVKKVHGDPMLLENYECI